MKKKNPKNSCNISKRKLRQSIQKECAQLPPIEEVQELEEFHYGTMMTTSTDNIYLNGHKLGALPWVK